MSSLWVLEQKIQRKLFIRLLFWNMLIWFGIFIFNIIALAMFGKYLVNIPLPDCMRL